MMMCFKQQYAAVLVQLNEANTQVSSALFRLRQRNTYQTNFHPSLPSTVGDSSDKNQTEESKSQVIEIVEISTTKARTMVDIAIQAMSSLKLDPTVEIDKAVDYVNDRIPLDDNFVTVHHSEKCTERQFQPAEVASILDSAVSSLQPRSPQNVQVYADIQKSMGIIKNQILALVPT